MKRLALLLTLIAFPAAAQTYPNHFKPSTGAQVLAYDSTARGSTVKFFFPLVRLTCTTSCFFITRISGSTQPATTATGSFLPSLTPFEFLAPRNGTLSVIQQSGAGTAYIIELAR